MVGPKDDGFGFDDAQKYSKLKDTKDWCHDIASNLTRPRYPILGLILVMLVLVVSVTTLPSVQGQPAGRYVILTMDDNSIGQYNYAKPVLDTYGYKASFMIVCNWVGNTPRMTWSQIADLANDGQDIESHTMTHGDLTHMSATQLDYELGMSKQCLKQHGYNATVFAYPRNLGSENSTVVNVVSKYYKTAKTLFNQSQEPLWFLTCNGYQSPLNQNNCVTYTWTGKLQYSNQYTVRMNSIDNLEQAYNFNDTAVYNVFVDWMNSQTQYNINGSIIAIPVVTVHEIVDPATPSSWLNTNQILFAHMLQYLHDNNFTVLTMKDLGYNNNSRTMYIKDLMQPTQTVSTVLKSNHIKWQYWGVPITVSGKLLTTSGIPIGGKTVMFTGNGAINLHQVVTKLDGTFAETAPGPGLGDLSPKGFSWNEFQVNEIFTGNYTVTPSVGVQYYAAYSHPTALTLSLSNPNVSVNGTFNATGSLTDQLKGTPVQGTISILANSTVIATTTTNSTGWYNVNKLQATSYPSKINIQAQFGGTLAYNKTNSTVQTLTVSNSATTLTLNPITSVPWSNNVIVMGKLTNQSGIGLGGKIISFSGTGAAGLSSVTTNPDGTFSVTGASPSTVANGWQVNANFGGDGSADSSAATKSYNTLKHNISLTLVISPSSIIPSGGTYRVSGILKDATTSSILSGMTITFSATSPITIPSATTNSTGNYLVSGLIAPGTTGSYSIKAQFAGSSLYSTYSLARTLTVT